MPKETEQKLKNINHWGYYDEQHEFVLEILKEDLIKYLKQEFDVKHIKIV